MKISNLSGLGLVLSLAACGGTAETPLDPVGASGPGIYEDLPFQDAIAGYPGGNMTGTITAFEIANTGLEANTALPSGSLSYSGGLAFAETGADDDIVRAYNGTLTLISQDPISDRQFYGLWQTVTAETGDGRALSVDASRVTISGRWGVANAFDPSIVIDGAVGGVLTVDGDRMNLALGMGGTFAGDDSGTALGFLTGFTDDYDAAGIFVAERD